MMQNTRYYSFCLLMLHAALLLFLSFYFLVREDYLLQFLQQELPLQFLLRFCAFWFASFVFTFSVFLVYVHRYQLQMPAVERSYALQAGRFAFSIGSGAAALFFLLLYVLFLR